MRRMSARRPLATTLATPPHLDDTVRGQILQHLVHDKICNVRGLAEDRDTKR